MKTWTAHTRPGREPVLVQEGFSLGAFLFGPAWLLLGWGAWIVALACFAATLGLEETRLVPGWAGFALPVLFGVFGRDLVRLDLRIRGWRVTHVVAAPDGDAALLRLIDRHPGLVSA